jgi:hypothetical protein
MFFLLFLLKDKRIRIGRPKNIWILRIRIRNTAPQAKTGVKFCRIDRDIPFGVFFKRIRLLLYWWTLIRTPDQGSP